MVVDTIKPREYNCSRMKKNPQNEPRTSPFGRKLLEDLREAGDRGLNPQRLKSAGVLKELKKLSKQGFAVSLGDLIFISAEVYNKHARTILGERKPGEEISVSEARNSTGLSRKYLFPILNRMETEGFVKREGNVRVVLG